METGPSHWCINYLHVHLQTFLISKKILCSFPTASVTLCFKEVRDHIQLPPFTHVCLPDPGLTE